MVLPALMLIASMFSAGCTMAARSTEPAAAPGERTVRISSSDFGGEVDVLVGDVLVVEKPADFDEWDVAFSTDVLKSLNTAEGRRKPPADGWTFAVVGKGTTDLAFTPYVPEGGTRNVPRFVVTVTAR